MPTNLHGPRGTELCIEVTLRLDAVHGGPHLATLKQPPSGKLCWPTSESSHDTVYIRPVSPLGAINADGHPSVALGTSLHGVRAGYQTHLVQKSQALSEVAVCPGSGLDYNF